MLLVTIVIPENERARVVLEKLKYLRKISTHTLNYPNFCIANCYNLSYLNFSVAATK